MSAAEADFLKALQAVDDPVILDNSKLTAVVKWFTGNGIPSMTALQGLQADDFDELPKDMNERAFVRRALEFVVTEKEITKRRRLTAGMSAAPTPARTSGTIDTMDVVNLCEILGGEQSAGGSAKAQLAAVKDVDINAKLKAANMAGMPWHLIPDMAVWKVLDSEAAQATLAGRSPFVYVDLTAKEFLPVWLPHSAVGAKVKLPGDASEGSLNTATLGTLGEALKAATSSPRFFRNVNQWYASFQRYGVAAVATAHLTMVQVACHSNVILKIAEEELTAGRDPLLAVLYDELCRRQWARRAEANDPLLDLQVECQKVDEQTLDTARTRFAQVRGRSSANPGSLSPTTPVGDAGLAAQSRAVASLEQLQDRSQRAANMLQAQAAAMEAKFKAMQNGAFRPVPPIPPDVPGKGKGRGKGKGGGAGRGGQGDSSGYPHAPRDRRYKQWAQKPRDAGKWKGSWY